MRGWKMPKINRDNCHYCGEINNGQYLRKVYVCNNCYAGLSSEKDLKGRKVNKLLRG